MTDFGRRKIENTDCIQSVLLRVGRKKYANKKKKKSDPIIYPTSYRREPLKHESIHLDLDRYFIANHDTGKIGINIDV